VLIVFALLAVDARESRRAFVAFAWCMAGAVLLLHRPAAGAALMM